MRNLVLSSLVVMGGVACQASANNASVQNGETPSPALSPERPTMPMTFDTPQAIAGWRAVNDGVMGGLSRGGPSFNDGALRFTGTINTNGGGFSSIRHSLTPGDLRGADGMRLRVKSDGRAYRLTFRTSQAWRGRSVSWQIPIPPTPPGEWAEVTVRFDDAEASIFGRPVRAGPFDPLDAREVGIIIADGKDGPFALEVAGMTRVTSNGQ